MEENELQTLNTLIQRGQTPQTVGNNHPFVIVPSDCRLEDLEKFDRNPARKIAKPLFTRASSFIDYVNDHKTPASRLYVLNATSLVAVLNHNASDKPDWGDHRAMFNLTQTPEWVFWKQKNTNRFGQRDFAQFIEDHSDVISRPSGTELLELVRSLKWSQKVDCVGEIDERDEDSSISFVIHTQSKGGKDELELPTEIILQLSPYEGGQMQSITARLRVEMCPPRIGLWYELVKIEQAERVALEGIVSDVEKGTGLTGWFGTP